MARVRPSNHGEIIHLYNKPKMLVFLQKHEFDWQIPSQIVFSDDHMKTSPGHCGHFGHRDAWFQWDKSMISAKRVLWKIFECRVCQFSRPPRLWIDTRPSRMAIYVQMAIPNSISHTNSIRKRIPDRFSDFSVIAISLQYWSCLPYVDRPLCTESAPNTRRIATRATT